MLRKLCLNCCTCNILNWVVDSRQMQKCEIWKSRFKRQKTRYKQQHFRIILKFFPLIENKQNVGPLLPFSFYWYFGSGPFYVVFPCIWYRIKLFLTIRIYRSGISFIKNLVFQRWRSFFITKLRINIEKISQWFLHLQKFRRNFKFADTPLQRAICKHAWKGEEQSYKTFYKCAGSNLMQASSSHFKQRFLRLTWRQETKNILENCHTISMIYTFRSNDEAICPAVSQYNAAPTPSTTSYHRHRAEFSPRNQ